MKYFIRAYLPVLAIILFILAESAVFLFTSPSILSGSSSNAAVSGGGSGVPDGGKKPGVVQTGVDQAIGAPDSVDSSKLYKYQHIEYQFAGHKSQVYILEIDPRGMAGLAVKPVLAQDEIFGFENMSSMDSRTGAAATVNAGFFTTYGEPSGLVVIDGKLLKKPTGRYPDLLIKDGAASLKQLDSRIYIEAGGGGAGNNNRIYADQLNSIAMTGQIVVFTPEFGIWNRVTTANTTITVKDGMIKGISTSAGRTMIPENGFLVTFLGAYSDTYFKKRGMIIGARLDLKTDPSIDAEQAYECGSWILKGGVDVTKSSDPWVGVLTNRDPRTAVGIKKDNTLVFVVVDGRQPGYSDGFTAKELAAFLLKYDVRDAAMLDGGASSEMIINGRMVSKPSFKGLERAIGGCIALIPINAPDVLK